jgi:hypothetical protein
MSYDILITPSPEPYEQSDDMLDVAELICAVNGFPAFAARGIRWDNEGWFEDTPWQGLVFYLEDHAPTLRPDGTADERSGIAGSCRLCISYGRDADLDACRELAAHIARALGMHAWDLQSDEDLTAL